MLGIKCVLKHQDLQMLALKSKRKTNFHTIEVVDRGSETQLQMGENSNNLSRQDKD